MKNKTKGLIALIAMTAATAVAAGSSTFAWFQTNRNANLKFNKITIAKRGSNELKAELYKAGVAAMEEGWTFMDASFQLGGKARDDGMDGEEVEQILR
ncbi:MAG: hypothetical protein II520_02945, partial [Bacilli bacterium]|nr:hypothetical protein [Bacilli bacterium]